MKKSSPIFARLPKRLIKCNASPFRCLNSSSGNRPSLFNEIAENLKVSQSSPNWKQQLHLELSTTERNADSTASDTDKVLVNAASSSIDHFSIKSRNVQEQYADFKSKFPTHIVLMQVGDFYEIYGDDVDEACAILEIASCKQTAKRQYKMTGVPVKSSDNYFEKLLKAGKSIVICDQVQLKSDYGDKFVRKISRIATPGTVVEDNMLDRCQYNFLLAVAVCPDGSLGLAWLDFSTGYFALKSASGKELESEVFRIEPKELICEEHTSRLPEIKKYVSLSGTKVTTTDHSNFSETFSYQFLLEAFKSDDRLKDIDQFSISELRAASALLMYLKTIEFEAKPVIHFPIRNTSDKMNIDAATFRSLEILKNNSCSTSNLCLFHTINKTATAMGARLLSTRLQYPSIDMEQLNTQYDLIELLLENETISQVLRSHLKECHDLDRSIQRLALNRQLGGPRDMQLVGNTLKQIPQIKQILEQLQRNLQEDSTTKISINQFLKQIADFSLICNKLDESLKEELPSRPTEGGMIRSGYSAELDQIRSRIAANVDVIPTFTEKYRLLTGKKSLKVFDKKLLGTFIEINVAEGAISHPDFQFLSQSEGKIRYKTNELSQIRKGQTKDEEAEILLEYQIYEQLRSDILQRMNEIRNSASVISELDLLQSMSTLAREDGFVRPVLTSKYFLSNFSSIFSVEKGRHPVVEKVQLRNNKHFESNDCILGDKSSFMLITGPNMGGKSTFLRQNALIAIMAQAGSFVPASRAEIGIVDAIFTRIGASDDISKDQSTFMTEMLETAAILNKATNRSLVIMDEVGRGTSTREGFALAVSICEYLVNIVRSRTLFATHYHLLASQLQHLPQVSCYSTDATEHPDGSITFSHKVKEGVALKSFGIQIAKLAGLPQTVIDRAKDVYSNFQE